MEYVAAILGAIAGGGGLVLGILLYRSGQVGRKDLLKLVQCTKDLADAKRDHQATKHAFADLEKALADKTAELSRETRALDQAREALAKAHAELAKSGDSAGVAAGINSLLGELSKMSSVSKTTTP